MSTNATVYVGYYLECKMKQAPVEETDHECSRDSNHSFNAGDKFCPQCGSKIHSVVLNGYHPQSLSDVSYNNDTPFVNAMSSEDVEWLNKFEHVPNEWIDYNRDGYEIVVISRLCKTVDADSPGLHHFAPPSQDDIEQIDFTRLKDIMEYQEITLNHGALVCWA